MQEKYDPQQLETKWRKQWDKDKTYKWNPDLSRENNFVIDTPPPTVSGSLHLGHIFSYTHTDLLARYHRMQGKNVFYPMGWDDNGLPTERRVQNVFGVRCDLEQPYDPNYQPRRDKGKKEKAELISRSNFIELCTILTLEDEQVFESLFKRVGLSIDWSLQYSTINDHCRKTSQASFLELVEKDQVYHKETPTQWDVDFQTAVAQAEVEDREAEGLYHNIKFKIEEGGEFTISTTRPEMLPACIAVVAHPEDSRYQPFFGKYAITPVFGAKVPILPAEHADPDKGTGILMICTFGDSNDVDWWKQSKLPLKQILDFQGRMQPVQFGSGVFESVDSKKAQNAYDQLKGLYVKKARKLMPEILGESLVKEPERTQRMVKFYEKGERPLEFIPTRQWFTKILDHQEKLLQLGSEIQWHPSHMKSRYDHWVQGLNQDWCISRQRYFGVPFPVWYKVNQQGQTDYGFPLFAKKEDLPIDPLKETPPDYTEDQRGQPGGFVADPDVMDTWATSSLTPQIASEWSSEGKRHQQVFPADLRPQSHEIIRTWAFYTITKSFLHEGKAPWKNIAISGWILDPDRKKMSKSKGNVVTPESYLDQYSSDAVRYWAARAKLGMDTAFDEKVFKMGWKLCNKLFNASKFVMGLVEKQDQAQVEKITETLDLSWMGLLNQGVEKATQAFEQFDYAQALQVTEELFWNFCDHYLEIVKARAYSDDGTSAQATLDLSLKSFLQLFAPFFPFLTEEIWSWRYAQGKSLHQENWPSLFELENKKEASYFHQAQELITLIRGEKTRQQKKLRWPVTKLTVYSDNLTAYQAVMPDIQRTGNIESVEYQEDSSFKVQILLAETES